MAQMLAETEEDGEAEVGEQDWIFKGLDKIVDLDTCATIVNASTFMSNVYVYHVAFFAVSFILFMVFMVMLIVTYLLGGSIVVPAVVLIVGRFV